jgi:hypothetical protein
MDGKQIILSVKFGVMKLLISVTEDNDGWVNHCGRAFLNKLVVVTVPPQKAAAICLWCLILTTTSV